jgi:O-antigen biosynthesis protein
VKVDIIIPTFNLPDYAIPCVLSILKNGGTDNLNSVILANNGTPESLNYMPPHPKLKILQQKTNLGWESGLKAGLAESHTPYVILMNDDTFISRSESRWLSVMLSRFEDAKVGAVGPTSNVVMGAQQMTYPSVDDLMEAPFLVGFCVMIRREALDKAGGIDDTLPNHGDDIDLSIRLRLAGYKLLIDRTVFVYHYGFKTGERVHGSYWNSMEMQDKTNFSLIRKHGLRTVLGTLFMPQYSGYKNGL